MHKKVLFLFLLFAGLTGILFAQSEDDFGVTQQKDGTLVINQNYRGPGGDIVVPNRIHGISLSIVDLFWRERGSAFTSIVFSTGIKQIGTLEEAPGMYMNNDGTLTSVNLPNGLLKIGALAFQKQKLSSVTIPNTVTFIGANAFEANQLTTISIPKSVTSIGSDAFAKNPLVAVQLESVFTIKENQWGGGTVFPSTNLIGIIIPANWPNAGLEALGFGTNFTNFYISQNRKAGTYIKRGQIWTLGTAQEFQQILSEKQKAEEEKVAKEKSEAKQKAAGLPPPPEAERPRERRQGVQEGWY